MIWLIAALAPICAGIVLLAFVEEEWRDSVFCAIAAVAIAALTFLLGRL